MLLDNLNKYKVILASASPRRQELLQHLDIDYTVETRPVDEDYPASLTAEQVAVYLSELKANAFEADIFNEPVLLITADTIVCLEEEILGKPAERDEAVRMLERLSGMIHKVITGVSIRTKERKVNFAVSTDVYFKQLRKEEIYYYVDNYRPFDKAGAYGIQEWIGMAGIEKIEGSFYNVMGLPVLRLYEELLKF